MAGSRKRKATLRLFLELLREVTVFIDLELRLARAVSRKSME